MLKPNKINLFLTICVTLFLIVAVLGGLRLIKLQKARKSPFLTASAIYSAEVSLPVEILPVFGSKNGTKYYLESCGAVARIKPENLTRFASKEEAEKNGYTPAQNCAELKDYLEE